MSSLGSTPPGTCNGVEVILDSMNSSRRPCGNGSYGTVIGNWYALSNSNNRLKAYLYDHSVLEGVWHTRSYVSPIKPI